MTYFPHIRNTLLEHYWNIQMPEAHHIFIVPSSNGELIVFGTVVNVKPISTSVGTKFVAREHKAELAQAVVNVKETLRGTLANKQISVLFYNSSDIAFEQTPKLKVEDKGVYFLKKFRPQGPETLNLHGYGYYCFVISLYSIRKRLLIIIINTLLRVSGTYSVTNAIIHQFNILKGHWITLTLSIRVWY